MMTNTKNTLPGIGEKIYLTDGGLETVLIFQKGIDLPHFASFPLLNTEEGKKTIKEYYVDFINIAKENNMGFVMESATWRANPDWGYKLGFNNDELDKINMLAINELKKMKLEHENIDTPIIISGNIGPRGDGYSPDNSMNCMEAKKYHSRQIKAFKSSGADLVTALTLNYIEEAIGIVLAAKEFSIPVVISFTVETDGKLPTGSLLEEAIKKVDELTNNYAEYFMINCAHPTHFMQTLNTNQEWKNRIKGIRANASDKSSDELDESTELHSGNKFELADKYVKLMELLPNLKVIGGCCGTDHTHVKEICNSIVCELQ